MGHQSERLVLTIDAGTDADDEELARLSQQLRAQLLQLDVDRVELVRSGPAPDGSKAGDAIMWGSLLVTLATTSPVLPAVLETVRSWLERDDKRSIVVKSDHGTLELSSVSSEQQQQLIDAFINNFAPA